MSAIGKWAQAVTTNQMRVLVVEDEKKTASFIRKALQAESFAVDVSHDGAEALSLAGRPPSTPSCWTSCCPDATG